MRVYRDAYPMWHPVTGERGEWQGEHLPEGATTERGYETTERWVPMCGTHRAYLPCARCEAMSLGPDEGDET